MQHQVELLDKQIKKCSESLTQQVHKFDGCAELVAVANALKKRKTAPSAERNSLDEPLEKDLILKTSVVEKDATTGLDT